MKPCKEIKEIFELSNKYDALKKRVEEDIRDFLPDDVGCDIKWINQGECYVDVIISGQIDLKYINQISSYIGIMPIIDGDMDMIALSYKI